MTVRRISIGWPVWLVVVAVLAGLVVWQALEVREDRRDGDRRDAAVEIVSDQVLDLTTLDADTVSSKLKKMSDRSAGAFADEIYGITSTFQSIVDEKALKATGSIDSVAVTSYEPEEATLLVASTAKVSEGDAEPVERTFRMSVDVEWVKGGWKVTGMEFVQ